MSRDEFVAHFQPRARAAHWPRLIYGLTYAAMMVLLVFTAFLAITVALGGADR